ncbi:S9 family peptidase [Henriciella sp.]|uniref:S9 family peptidase n=1 Tax=Henriciella sp. TaxID=1968823 RepID=UPI00260F7D13|nr:DPP IV N-terminal domain-containing protein [Henriciella sp.]
MNSLTTGLAATAFAALCAFSSASAQPKKDTMASKELTIERLYASPSLNGPSPTGVKYSPDGQRVTFLKAREADSSRYDLWQFDVETGEQSMLVDSTLLEPEEVELSEEEKALRERKRIAGRKGIVSYDWGTNDTILVPIGGDLHLVTLGEDGPQARQLTETEAFEYDARVSPDGRQVSFVRDGAVYAIELETGTETQLTPDAEPEKAISYGVAEFVAQEEMSRYTGYWWSPDARYIAYAKVDESTVDVIPRFDIKAEETTVVEQRYPRAGRPNAVVDLFVHDMETGKTHELDWRNDDWGPATDQYLARVNWAGDALIVQSVDRDQTIIRTTQHWPETLWGVEPLATEKQDRWVNLSKDFTPLSSETGTLHDQGEIAYLTTSEESGYRHIIKHGRDDETVALTSGQWAVSAIAGSDPEGGTVFFTGFKDTPLEKHLYSVPAEGGDITRITEPGKSWSITMSPDGKSFVGTSSSPSHPPQTGLYTAEGELIAWIEENALDESHPYAPYLDAHAVPEFGTLKAEDGQDLYYSILKPADFDPTKQYPVIIEVYGGPHVQTVDRDWESLSDQYLTRQGYIVFRLDNRGMANRGKQFEDVIYRRTGGPEVRDQLVGVDWLKSRDFVDPDRIAIQGWSYGGYMTLMTILQSPENTFAAAAAGAPVTDWKLYDTFYTERYMDTPQDNAEGYEQSSVFAHAENLTTPLLLMHGMADDNVTFDNTTRLMAEWQEMGKQFELMTYPGQRHGIQGEALKTHLMKTRMNFLNRHLKPQGSD